MTQSRISRRELLAGAGAGAAALLLDLSNLQAQPAASRAIVFMAANRGVIRPIPALRDAGCPIALGTDNNTNEVFEVMRIALLMNGTHLIPDAPRHGVRFAKNRRLVQRQHLVGAHDELAIHHHRFDVRGMSAVDDRRHQPARRNRVPRLPRSVSVEGRP